MHLDRSQIQAILPHREPFLLVDDADVTPGESVTASLYADPAWEVFCAHFPGHPVLPGNCLTESLAQAADLALLTLPEQAEKLPILTQVKHMRFIRPVSPGDTVSLQVTITGCGQGLYDCEGSAFISSRRAAAGAFTIALR